MDYVSHGVWSYNFFHRSKCPLYAVFFGLLPDNCSWVIYFFYRLFSREPMGKPVLDQIPGWVFTLYGISHSLVVCAAILIVVGAVRRGVPVYMWAWPIAIVMDVLTHTREFLPTPFLWPVSDWHFPGISWARPWFMAVNYPIMLALFVWALWAHRRRAGRVPAAKSAE